MEEKTQTYYELLDVSPKSSQNEIATAYRKIMKSYHPDKIKHGSMTETTKTYINSVNRAYNVLRDPMKRSEYDNSLKINTHKQCDFIEMKEEYEKFYASMNTDIRCQEDAREKFQRQNLELNSKIGFAKQTRLNDEDLDKQVMQMVLMREQEDIENTPDKEYNDEQERTREVIPYTGDIAPFNMTTDETQDGVLCDVSGMPINENRTSHATYKPTSETIDSLYEKRLQERERGNMRVGEYDKTMCYELNGLYVKKN